MGLSQQHFGEAPHVFNQLVAGASLALAEVNPDAIAMPADLVNAVESRRRAYVAGQLCATRALSRAGSIDLYVGRTESGAPVWPSNFRGSITHTNEMAFAVAIGNPKARVGIDSEPLLSAKAMTDVFVACCTPDEVAYLSDQHDARLATTIAFSIKESFYKAISDIVGGTFDFKDIIVRTIDMSHQSIELVASERIHFSQCLPRFSYDGHAIHTSILLAE